LNIAVFSVLYSAFCKEIYARYTNKSLVRESKCARINRFCSILSYFLYMTSYNRVHEIRSMFQAEVKTPSNELLSIWIHQDWFRGFDSSCQHLHLHISLPSLLWLNTNSPVEIPHERNLVNFLNTRTSATIVFIISSFTTVSCSSELRKYISFQ